MYIGYLCVCVRERERERACVLYCTHTHTHTHIRRCYIAMTLPRVSKGPADTAETTAAAEVDQINGSDAGVWGAGKCREEEPDAHKLMIAIQNVAARSTSLFIRFKNLPMLAYANYSCVVSPGDGSKLMGVESRNNNVAPGKTINFFVSAFPTEVGIFEGNVLVSRKEGGEPIQCIPVLLNIVDAAEPNAKPVLHTPRQDVFTTRNKLLLTGSDGLPVPSSSPLPPPGTRPSTSVVLPKPVSPPLLPPPPRRASGGGGYALGYASRVGGGSGGYAGGYVGYMTGDTAKSAIHDAATKSSAAAGVATTPTASKYAQVAARYREVVSVSQGFATAALAEAEEAAQTVRPAKPARQDSQKFSV